MRRPRASRGRRRATAPESGARLRRRGGLGREHEASRTCAAARGGTGRVGRRAGDARRETGGSRRRDERRSTVAPKRGGSARTRRREDARRRAGDVGRDVLRPAEHARGEHGCVRPDCGWNQPQGDGDPEGEERSHGLRGLGGQSSRSRTLVAPSRRERAAPRTPGTPRGACDRAAAVRGRGLSSSVRASALAPPRDGSGRHGDGCGRCARFDGTPPHALAGLRRDYARRVSLPGRFSRGRCGSGTWTALRDSEPIPRKRPRDPRPLRHLEPMR